MFFYTVHFRPLESPPSPKTRVCSRKTELCRRLRSARCHLTCRATVGKEGPRGVRSYFLNFLQSILGRKQTLRSLCDSARQPQCFQRARRYSAKGGARECVYMKWHYRNRGWNAISHAHSFPRLRTILPLYDRLRIDVRSTVPDPNSLSMVAVGCTSARDTGNAS